MFESAGPEAVAVVKLWWVLLGVGLIVLLAVSAFLLVGCFRNRQLHEGRRLPVSDRRLYFALVIGVAPTVILLLVMLVAAHRYSQPFADERDDALTIEVSGKLWWWAVTYLDENGERLFETANEIHIPAGTPVRLRLVSDNVIHSFWAPGLGGKVDLVPGRTNYLWLQAQQPGTYRGQCAEFCGAQHAKMAFLVMAEPAEEFADWMVAQQASAAEPKSDLARRGREVFQKSACADCHTVRGVSLASHLTSPDRRVVGPDLTHLASRQSLAAVTLPNHRGHLGGWIADPQNVKPASLMPSVPLAGEDFHALLHYLETLK